VNHTGYLNSAAAGRGSEVLNGPRFHGGPVKGRRTRDKKKEGAQRNPVFSSNRITTLTAEVHEGMAWNVTYGTTNDIVQHQIEGKLI